MTRHPCCIPHCKRTTATEFGNLEWICGKHWSTTSKRLRSIYHKRRRRWNKGDLSQAPHLARIWVKLKKQAMEGAMY